MSLQTNLTNAFTRVGTEIKGLHTTDTSQAATLAQHQTDIVALQGAVGGPGVIDDTAAAADKTYSSNKITADIAAARLDAINTVTAGAGPALDTLAELSTALGNDANFATTVTNSIALKANIADTYTQVDIGDVNHNYVADFEAALL